jgi:hypothetical protein
VLKILALIIIYTLKVSRLVVEPGAEVIGDDEE